MAYSDFTMDMLRRDFGIRVCDRVFFDAIGELLPSPWLSQSLEQGTHIYTGTEKARGEFIVAPILLACCDGLPRIKIFSGSALNGNPDKGLTGPCDFILARSESQICFQTPLMVVMQAKKHDINQSLAECVAQMLGACCYNEREGKHLPYVYGCVTTGEVWLFLKLQGNELQVHPERFTVREVSKVLWFLVECLKDVDQQVSEAA